MTRARAACPAAAAGPDSLPCGRRGNRYRQLPRRPSRRSRHLARLVTSPPSPALRRAGALGQPRPAFRGHAGGRVPDGARQHRRRSPARRQALGPDDPGTLTVANSLTLPLRELEDHAAARELDEDTVERCRRTLGEDHLDTLRTAGNLAANLHLLGLYRESHTLNKDTLDRYRRILGDDHPHTLRTASNLANDLSELGEAQAAIVLYEDVLARRQQLLGNDHPDTRRAANNLINALMDVGDYVEVFALRANLGLLS